MRHDVARLQHSPYFCVFKYARAVKQKVWNEAENRERDWGETLRACETRAPRGRKTFTPRFIDFFTTVLQSTMWQNVILSNPSAQSLLASQA